LVFLLVAELLLSSFLVDKLLPPFSHIGATVAVIVIVMVMVVVITVISRSRSHHSIINVLTDILVTV
jgi:hypothetical protein